MIGGPGAGGAESLLELDPRHAREVDVDDDARGLADASR